MARKKPKSQSAVDASLAAKTRFERHPYLTLSVILIILFAAVVGMVELGLRIFHERVGLTLAEQRGQPRVLNLREWPPGMVRLFAPPKGRSANDPIGPVQPLYELKIDESGFIEPSIIHAKPDLEIAFLGASTTECLFVRPLERFPYLVGRMLEASSGLKINSLNVAKSGNNTMHTVLNYLGKVAPRRPDFVVLMGVGNDIGFLTKAKSYWKGRKSIALVRDERSLRGRQPIADFLERLRESTIPYTYRLVRRAFDSIKVRMSASRSPVVPAADTSNSDAPIAAPDQAEIQRRERVRNSYEPALRSFVRLAKAWGSEPVLMTEIALGEKQDGNSDTAMSIATLRQENPDPADFASRHEYANAIVRYVAHTEGAILIDLAAARRWTREDVYDGKHLTETGSRHVAQIVEQALAPRIAAMANSRE
jgi:lysophospholipase L1-like esterase